MKYRLLRHANESWDPAWLSPGVCSFPPLGLNIYLLLASPPHSWLPRTLHSLPHFVSSRYQLPVNVWLIFFPTLVLSTSNIKVRRDL